MSNTRPRVAVVDHGAGNLVSIAQALERVGAEVAVVESPDGLSGADGVVLPGVGSTATVMEGIRSHGFEAALAREERPLLGICVGMQVLFETSEEDGAGCLGILEGVVRRLEEAPKLPHIGWNDLEVTGRSDLYEGVADPVVYFVHSFAPVPSDPEVVTATSEYGARFVAGVRAGQVEGVQFHPERSGTAGLRILSRFVARCQEAARVA
ncbi:MAG TPA: imidazole glycerol phosphate synthase subunit HisH [Acidimicrobiia bacterium]|nr:imidazole glycerol phosphate synthase subunit HisH [Acidimicrobiia bacterium]HZI39851.1 imidazole glycerol phosphate synthase subunit HisH [Acidimicrobiia bacterium]